MTSDDDDGDAWRGNNGDNGEEMMVLMEFDLVKYYTSCRHHFVELRQLIFIYFSFHKLHSVLYEYV